MLTLMPFPPAGATTRSRRPRGCRSSARVPREHWCRAHLRSRRPRGHGRGLGLLGPPIWKAQLFWRPGVSASKAWESSGSEASASTSSSGSSTSRVGCGGRRPWAALAMASRMYSRMVSACGDLTEGGEADQGRVLTVGAGGLQQALRVLEQCAVHEGQPVIVPEGAEHGHIATRVHVGRVSPLHVLAEALGEQHGPQLVDVRDPAGWRRRTPGDTASILIDFAHAGHHAVGAPAPGTRHGRGRGADDASTAATGAPRLDR